MISPPELLLHAKPTEDEIANLAILETDPAQVARFEPIARGPVFALAALAVVILISVPGCLIHILRGLLRSRKTEE